MSWTGPEPVGRIDDETRRPVVAVLDTGVGEHPWLGSDHVMRDPRVLGRLIGLGDTTGRDRDEAAGDGMVGELQPDSGHGTFIAGLVRQACPDARLLDVRLFDGTGVVVESELLRSLQLLALRQVLATTGDPAGDEGPLDVLALSLGYYHEDPTDAAFDVLLDGPLRVLGRYGVAVVVSAGNDASTRPVYPAVFAPHPGGPVPDDDARVPVTAVGALNPDGTIALFSNDGPWVRFHRPGAALVSTMPTTFDAALEPSHAVENGRGELRTALDPDDFSAGFGVWSGTSFAAPVFAGQVAARLARLRVGAGEPTVAERVATLRDLLETMPGRRADQTDEDGEE